MTTLLNRLLAFYHSSIGKKWIVALTALVLVGFVLGHMIGNLLIYAGPEAINSYAVFLKHSLHGAGIWIARITLLVSVVLHIVTAIHLAIQNRAARTSRYGVDATVQASSASRYMAVSGLIVLVFIIFHILHFTVQAGSDFSEMIDSEGRHDVYSMVIAGFQNILVSLFYIVSMALLCWHLSHGVSSLFQTLGITTQKTEPLFKALGLGFAIVILVGNCSIPLSVLFGWLG